MHCSTTNFTKYQYLNMLEDCKQIPKNDRLVLRKLLLLDDEEIKKMLLLKDKKRMQVKLRKLVDILKSKKEAQETLEVMEADLKWKENFKKTFFVNKAPAKKTTLLQKNKNIREKSADNLSKWSKRHIQFTYPVKKSVYREKSCPKNVTLDNSRSNHESYIKNLEIKNMKHSVQLQQRINDTLSNDFFNPENRQQTQPNRITNFVYELQQDKNTGIYSNNNYLQDYQNSNQKELFTNQQLLEQCRAFMNKVVIGKQNTNEIVNQQISLKAKHHHSQSPQVRLKSLLLNLSSQQLFDAIISNVVKRDCYSFNSLFISYQEFIQKINDTIFKKIGATFIQKTEDQLINDLPIFPPFTSQFESVNMKKFVEFLQTYTTNQIHDIRTIFLILDSSMSGVINLEVFQAKNNWRGQEFIQKFIDIINRWGKYGQSISYWQFYWAKDSEQMQQFLNLYHYKK